jgi:putative spermidine/putrescine transport system ATP-binding protein
MTVLSRQEAFMPAAPDRTPSTAASGSVKLRAEGLTKTYGPVTALQSMSITVEEGEFLSLLGPSGSGKTTFLMMAAGLILPDSGALWINGKLATYLPVQDRDIGMVFQNYALFPHLTVFENIAFPLRMRKLPEKEIRAAVGQALETVHLSHAIDRLPRALSGGQQQRIALARCLVYKPSIILMDEPLGALDRKLREEMQLEIKRLHKALGTTLLYVTHDQDEAMTMSDRICLMNNGSIEQVGRPGELYHSPRTEFAADFLGDSNFLDAEIVGHESGRALLRLKDGQSIRVALRADSQKARAARVMVRPERLRIGPATPGTDVNEVSGRVSDCVLVGSMTRVYVTLGNAATMVATALTGTHERLPQPGEMLSLHWPVAATLAFPRDPSA